MLQHNDLFRVNGTAQLNSLDVSKKMVMQKLQRVKFAVKPAFLLWQLSQLSQTEIMIL